MGVYTHLLYSDNINSIATTVKSIIKPMKAFELTGTSGTIEIRENYSSLIVMRAVAAKMGGITDGNFLLTIEITDYYQMYEECFSGDIEIYKTELPLFVFTTIYFESPYKRETFAMADDVFKQEFFECIYDICKQNCSIQLLFSFSREGTVKIMSKFCSYLQRRYIHLK